MCAQFLIKTRASELKRLLGIQLPEGWDPDTQVDERIVPYKLAPVVISDGKNNVMKLMNFSLIPAWSKEPKAKFATHNARLDTIIEKPTWKRPFIGQRALVPITSFIEPIYENEFAGNMVDFSDKERPLLFAAAIYDEWHNKQTGEVIESFAIITDDPPKYVAEIGHDRCPVFVTEDIFKEWLEPIKKDPQVLVDMLNENRPNLKLQAKIDRPLKPGWEKRHKAK
jgi:putative SOS response-associated peptidase YedK